LRYVIIMFDKRKSETPAPEGLRDRMQRVRIGLTGLAVVLIIVVLATLIFQFVNVPAVKLDASKNSVDALQNKTQDEPLADLGVAPSAPGNIR
jgi:hypothetical protein